MSRRATRRAPDTQSRSFEGSRDGVDERVRRGAADVTVRSLSTAAVLLAETSDHDRVCGQKVVPARHDEYRVHARATMPTAKINSI